jgi:hypothetical protein
MKRLVVPPGQKEEIWRVFRLQTVIWATSEGLRCVVAPYDETRYQLRLLRPEGTIKTDLVTSLADANREARRWRAEVNEHRSRDWPDVTTGDHREAGLDKMRSALSCACDKAEPYSRRRRRSD